MQNLQGKKREKQRTRTNSSRAWHPSLMSITEASFKKIISEFYTQALFVVQKKKKNKQTQALFGISDFSEMVTTINQIRTKPYLDTEIRFPN